VSAGLKTLLQLQSTRQLGEHASATLATTWQPDLGFGLQLGTARQLSTHWHGEGNWIVGPRVASGLGVGLTRRDEKSALTCKLDVSIPLDPIVSESCLKRLRKGAPTVS
jgi:hypothetical protein